MRHVVTCLLAAACAAALAACQSTLTTSSTNAPPGPDKVTAVSPFVASYKGTPFKEPQVIPGRLMFAYFDNGPEGVAHHNYETKNEGSGALNNGPAEKDHFRQNDGLSTSYTKGAFDHWKKDGKNVPLDVYYVGWTFKGQWINYTVDVKTAGTYTMTVMITANNAPGGAISLDVDGVDKTGVLKIPSTGYDHNWEQLDNLAEITLPAGRHVLTFHVVDQGRMNLGHIDFALKQ